MKLSSAFILLTLTMLSRPHPLSNAPTEFDTDFEHIKKKLNTTKSCSGHCEEATDPECQCLYRPETMDKCTDYLCIEAGLKKLNFICDEDSKAELIVKTCNSLTRLENFVKDGRKMCTAAMSQQKFLNHILTLKQTYYSQQ